MTRKTSPATLTGLLGLVLAVACAVRLHALGVPMLLFEEGLVADTATHGWAYILRRSLETDAHPPFFYYLTKGLLLFGSSEVALRLLSAASGVAAVAMLYVVGARLFSRGVGVLAAAFLAVQFLHVELSRVLRPHSLIIFLSLVCLDRLLRFLENPTRRNVWLLALADVAVSLWHFNGCLILGAQAAILVCVAVRGRVPRRQAMGAVAACGVGLTLSLAPMLARIGRFPGVSVGSGSMLWTLEQTGKNLAEMLALYPSPWLAALGAALAVLGFVTLWGANRGLFFVIAATVALPPAVLIAARYGIIYSAQHIGFLLPPLALMMALGAKRLIGRAEYAAPPVLAAGCLALFVGWYGHVYAPDAPMINHNYCQRPIAQAMAQYIVPGAAQAVGFIPADFADFVGWYLRRLTGWDFRRNHVGPDDPNVEFFLVKSLAGGVAAPENGYSTERAGLRQSLVSRLDCPFSVTGFVIPRESVTPLSSLPCDIRLGAAPEDFYRRVREADDLFTFFSPLGYTQYPSRFDSPATFAYRFDNRTGQTVRNLDLTVFLAKTQPESVFELSYAFDGEPPRPGFTVDELTANGWVVLHLGRTEPFSTLDVAVRMVASSLQPTFTNNVESVSFRGMSLSADRPGNAFDSDVPLAATGLDVTETNAQGAFRWGRGPETRMTFRRDSAETLDLRLSARSNIAGQRIQVMLNGEPLGVIELAPGGGFEDHALAVPAIRGENVLSLRYAYWNHGGHGLEKETFEPQDPRPLAAVFSALRLVGRGAAEGGR